VAIVYRYFVFDDYQVYESAAAGADAILLIVAALDDELLLRLRVLAEDELGLDAVVEVHTSNEMKRALACGANLIGVNNRDLHTFGPSLDVSRDLITYAPLGAILISESGLRTHDDLVELSGRGYSGFLIGETLMRSGSPEVALKRLLAGDDARL
jgi:indole-3-glycerol phosphate synthase